MTKKDDMWIQRATNPKKEGALHRQLGYADSKSIPTGLLREIKGTKIGNRARGHTVTPLLKKRAVFALNVRRL